MHDDRETPVPHANGDLPATQDDIALWGGRLTERIDELGARLDHIEKTQVLIMRTVERIDERLVEQAEHTERIERLEDKVFAAGKTR